MKQTWSEFEQAFGPVVPGGPGRYTGGKNLSMLLTLCGKHDPVRILEISTAYGHTSVAIVRSISHARVYTFDVCKEYGGYDSHSPYVHEIMSKDEVGSVIRALQDDSRERIDSVVARAGDLPYEIRLRAPYELAFVDGDHTWRRVVNDTKLALETLTDTGTIVWDDYQEPCPEIIHFIELMNWRTGGLITLVEETRMGYTILTKEKKAKLASALSDL
jgi:predicted O-methyltransferase YrrM